LACGHQGLGVGDRPAKPANEVTIGFGAELSGLASQNHAPTPSACEPFREAIELGLSRGRNAMAIWQDLVADSGFRGSYQAVKRFVRTQQRGPFQVPAASLVPAEAP